MLTQSSPSDALFVVDDDPDVRQALSLAFTHLGYEVVGFPDGDSFLDTARGRNPACVLLDINLPGRSGLEVLKALSPNAYGAPVLVISARADIPVAVEAIRAGAYDFIEKPFAPDDVVNRVREACEHWDLRLRSQRSVAIKRAFPGQTLLTPREREVLSQITSGASNKEAGRRLGISPRTIEVHRARIMDKLGARNAADLVRIVLSEGQTA